MITFAAFVCMLMEDTSSATSYNTAKYCVACAFLRRILQSSSYLEAQARIEFNFSPANNLFGSEERSLDHARIPKALSAGPEVLKSTEKM